MLNFQSTLQIPTLETSRLKLRAHNLDDFSDCVAMWSDPVVTRYTIGAPASEQQTWRRMLAYLGHWSVLGFGYWAVEEKTGGRYIGELGFADFKRDLHPSIQGIPELGWALASSAHGKGYATEALRAVVAWGDLHFESHTVCLIQPENRASLRVAEKLGYRELTRVQKDGELDIVFSRDRRK